MSSNKKSFREYKSGVYKCITDAYTLYSVGRMQKFYLYTDLTQWFLTVVWTDKG
jgi:hypothetical protein